MKRKYKKIRNRKKIQRPYSTQKIKGDHIIRFYFYEKSHHPFMSVTKHGNYHDGHNMTTHPSLRMNKTIRGRYRRFRKNPNPDSSSISYYEGPLIRNVTADPKLMRLKKNWFLSIGDLKRLKINDKTKNLKIKKRPSR